MRNSRNFDGTSLTAKPLKGLLDTVLSEMSKESGHRNLQILAAWKEIIGPKFAKFTEATGVQKGVLCISVRSSTLYSILQAQEKPRLLAKLQEMFSPHEVRDILFRVSR